MKDKSDVLHKLGIVSSKPGSPAAAPVMEADESESRCFGFLRGVRDRALMLEFVRLKEGDSVAFPYSWLGPTHFHPSTGILLVFCGEDTFGVRIRGRNLNTSIEGMSLFDRGILRHRVTFIREVPGADSHGGDKNECVVERIEITRIAADESMRFLSVGG